MTPRSFGKYRVIDEIGRGGFGTVYEGRDPILRRPVAIKVLHSQRSDLQERFLREAKIAAGLQHPGITTVFDFGVEAGRPYLVQELLPGQDLGAVISRREAVHRRQRLGWLVEIASALHHAHEQGVVHRDVKPANVRLLEGGGIKILDFGIAKTLADDDGLTRSGFALGTLGYLAPEQLRGEPVDRRADIFAFGVLMYELLTYRRPFRGDSASAIVHQIAHEEPEPLRFLWPHCPSDLADLVHRCLAKEPGQRPNDLQAVIGPLRAALSDPPAASAREDTLPSRLGLPPSATPPAPPRPTRPPVEIPRLDPDALYNTAFRWLRRTVMAKVAALAVVAILGVAAGGWVWAQWGVEEGEAAASEVPLPGHGSDHEARDLGASPVQRLTELDGAEAQGLIEPPSQDSEDGDFEGAAAESPEDQRNSVKGAKNEGTETTRIEAAHTEVHRGAATNPEPPQAVAARPAHAPPRIVQRVLIALQGEPGAAAQTAETALLQALAQAGFDVVRDPVLPSAAGGHASPRYFGAAILVTGTFHGEAEASVGRFYTGRGRLSLDLLTLPGNSPWGSATAEVGMTSPGVLGASELAALHAAAEEAGRRAAAEVAPRLETLSVGGP